MSDIPGLTVSVAIVMPDIIPDDIGGSTAHAHIILAVMRDVIILDKDIAAEDVYPR